jgi:hypothetical protein
LGLASARCSLNVLEELPTLRQFVNTGPFQEVPTRRRRSRMAALGMFDWE